jgi:hypothetical protein
MRLVERIEHEVNGLSLRGLHRHERLRVPFRLQNQ